MVDILSLGLPHTLVELEAHFNDAPLYGGTPTEQFQRDSSVGPRHEQPLPRHGTAEELCMRKKKTCKAEYLARHCRSYVHSCDPLGTWLEPSQSSLQGSSGLRLAILCLLSSPCFVGAHKLPNVKFCAQVPSFRSVNKKLHFNHTKNVPKNAFLLCPRAMTSTLHRPLSPFTADAFPAA